LGAQIFAFGIGNDISNATLTAIAGSLSNVYFVATEKDLTGFVAQFIQQFPCTGPTKGENGSRGSNGANGANGTNGSNGERFRR
jgi:hypothetical protein